MEGKRIDRRVERLFLATAAPDGAKASRVVAKPFAEQESEALRRWQLDVDHCRYEASIGERRYRKVDPDNRLIASPLEYDWEMALRAL